MNITLTDPQEICNNLSPEAHKAITWMCSRKESLLTVGWEIYDLRFNAYMNDDDDEIDILNKVARELIAHNLVDVDECGKDCCFYSISELGTEVAQLTPSYAQRDPG